MRYGSEHKQQTRERIVATAAERFRAEGIDAVGVANLMKSAGLTHGGFYAHFESKDQLAAEACKASFGDTLPRLKHYVEKMPAGQRLAGLADVYLTPLHRDHPEGGCFAAALAGEVAHHQGPVRAELTHWLGELIALIDECAAADGVKVSGAAILAQMGGALVLSRVAADPALSDQFLAAGREAIRRLAASGSAA